MSAEKAFWKGRHSVLVVLVLGMTVSSIDRVAMSVAIPFIGSDLRLNATEMGAVMSAFFVSYALMQIPGGLIANRFGARKVAAVAMVWWSIFTALTGVASSFIQLLFARIIFGLGEGVFPPCCFATVANWFPRRERGTASGILLASTLLGGALSPLVVVAILSQFGWRAVFYFLFVPGILLSLAFWFFVADRPAASRHVAVEELREIEADMASEGQPVALRDQRLFAILTDPAVLKYFIVYFTFDLAYWGFTTWLPTYLLKARGFSMIEMGLLASLPSFAGTIGCVFGGWISDRFFSDRRHVPIVVSQLVSAVFLYMIFTSTSTVSLIVYQVFGGFFLMAFFGVFWALPMSTMASENVGVISGAINMSGQIAAFTAPFLIGFLVDRSDGGFGSTFAFLIICLLVSATLVSTIKNKGRELPRHPASD